MTAFITDPAGTIRLMTPYVVGAFFALPLLVIALKLRDILRHVKYQTALIEGRVRPVVQAPDVSELDAVRRRREAAE